MLPRLDVDFHFAPFVDARDHLGVAAARVTIGAPHFEKAREFWARPLLPFVPNSQEVNQGRGHILLRPVGAPQNHLLLLLTGNSWMSFVEASAVVTEPKWPDNWGDKESLQSIPLARCWRHPNLPLAVRLDSSDHKREATLFPLQMSQGDACVYEDPLQLSLDELIDWPTEKLHGAIERQFANRNSELALTWNWSQIPRGDRFQAFFARPEWNGFLRLMQCILISQAFLSPALAQSGAAWRFLEAHLGFIQINSNPPQIVNPKRAKVWMQTILDIYQRRETQQLTPAKMSLSYHYYHPLICSAPTHHEMLEARLQLHAWAREHLPPSRADELIALDDLEPIRIGKRKALFGARS